MRSLRKDNRCPRLPLAQTVNQTPPNVPAAFSRPTAVTRMRCPQARIPRARTPCARVCSTPTRCGVRSPALPTRSSSATTAPAASSSSASTTRGRRARRAHRRRDRVVRGRDGRSARSTSRFFRDDIGLRPVVPLGPTEVPDMSGRVVVLVDDVLYTGRTDPRRARRPEGPRAAAGGAARGARRPRPPRAADRVPITWARTCRPVSPRTCGCASPNIDGGDDAVELWGPLT